jgi:hypothetical protein
MELPVLAWPPDRASPLTEGLPHLLEAVGLVVPGAIIQKFAISFPAVRRFLDRRRFELGAIRRRDLRDDACWT